MEIAALILALVAVVVFLAAEVRGTGHVAFGLALVTAALICQFTDLTGVVVHS